MTRFNANSVVATLQYFL